MPLFVVAEFRHKGDDKRSEARFRKGSLVFILLPEISLEEGFSRWMGFSF